jgi:putative drug exporter of the RND superfamily
MLTRLGWFTVRRRKWVLSLTALFVVFAGVFGTRAFGVLQEGGFDDTSSESYEAQQLLVDRFGGGEPNLVLVVSADSGNVDDAGVGAAAEQLTSELQSLDGVAQVGSYWNMGQPDSLRSNDGASALVVATVVGDEEVVAESVEEATDTLAGDRGVIDVKIGGREAVNADIGRTIEGDLFLAEMIAIPLTLLLLLFVFRGVVAATLPLLVGVIAVLGTFLSLYVLGNVTDVSIYAINLTTALGLGLAIDYSLFIVSRFREELKAGRDVDHAVVRTVQTAGKTVLISSLTVAASLVALLVFPMYFLRSFAYAGAAVVLTALAGSLLSLPALLAAIGHRVNALPIGRRRDDRPADQGFWHRLATFVMRRPLPIALSVVAVLILLGSPFLRVSFGSPDDRVLPSSAPSRQASEALRSDFSGNTAESFGVVATDVPADADADILTTAATLSSLNGVARVDSAVGTFVEGDLVAEAQDAARFRSGDATWMAVVPAFAVVSAEGEALVEEIRTLDLPLDVAVEGQAASLVDTKDAISRNLPWALAIIVIVTFALLFLLSGSLLVPVKALVLNFLSLTATFGAMVWIFQDGNLSDLLGFTATGTLDTSMPILMFCIAFGLSMDYEVFLLSRIKEEHDRTGDNVASVALGLERTGRIVTAAAALLAITFFAFATSGVSFLKMFGLGLGIAVLMDATVVRGFLVPAFMRLAGEANWWAPRPLRRFHDRFGLREGDVDQEPVQAGSTADESDRELVGAGR